MGRETYLGDGICHAKKVQADDGQRKLHFYRLKGVMY